jgi:hypothetical protein
MQNLLLLPPLSFSSFRPNPAPQAQLRSQPASIVAASQPSSVKSAYSPSTFLAAARRPLKPSPASASGPAGPLPVYARRQPLTRGARTSAATSCRRSSRDRAGVALGADPRLGVHAASPRAHGSARLGPPPYKAATTLRCEPPVAKTLVAQRRRHPLPPPLLTRASVASRRQAAASAPPSLGKRAAGAT